MRGEPRPDANKDPVDQDRTRRKASSMAPLCSHDPIKSRGKTLTRTQKKERDEKEKRRTTPAISEKQATLKTQGTSSQRGRILLSKNPQSLRGNSTQAEEKSTFSK